MKTVPKCMVQKFATVLLTVSATLAAGAPTLNAKPRPVKTAVQPTAVIAHLALPGAPVSQLALQENGSKQYLYIEQSSVEGFAIVDVTKPNQPSVIKRQPWANESSIGRLQLIGAALGLAEASEIETVKTVSRAETLKVLDLTDPANPKTILSFSGVTSTLADDARNLVYIANGDGLWILKYPPQQPIFSAPRGCRTEDAFNELASCQ